MKKCFILSVVLLSFFFSASAQHKIVFDLASADTAVQSRVLRQFDAILKSEPDAQLELVCHGSAVYMLVDKKTHVELKMKELMQKGKVAYKVCANSMKRLGIDKSQIIGIGEIVPMAMLELSAKQKEGWSYIWAGN